MSRPAALPVAALALALAAPAAAQHAGPHGAAPMQPDAGRRIAALSQEDAAGLRAGRGMGLALAAERNGYPGPMHVLEHAEALGLTGAQRAAAEGLRARMQAEARILGARILVLEEELDRLFADGAADTGRLAALTASLGALNGRLREVHLAAHIAMRDALEPGQRAAYARLRGDAGGR